MIKNASFLPRLAALLCAAVSLLVTIPGQAEQPLQALHNHVRPAVANEQAAPVGTHPMVLTNPQVNGTIQFDVSRPLRDMATEVPSQMGFYAAPPVKYPKLQLLQTAPKGAQPDEALQNLPGPEVSATLGLNLLGLGTGFPGFSVSTAPPDPNLAVGDTQILQWVNSSYAVFDKNTGAVIAGPIIGNAFWSGFGGPCQANNSGDPIAQWDKIAHRWVVSQNVFSTPYMTCVAISTTPDATGTYYRFAFQQPGFPDYPKWGIWPDAYYQSQNNFGASGNTFVGAYACAYDRAKMLVGDSTAKQICFQTGTFDDSLLPGDLDSAASLPPSGEQEVFLGCVDCGANLSNITSVYQYLFHVDFANPSNSTFTGVNGTMPITVASFGLACWVGGGNGACIQQPSPGEALDSLGERLMYRLAYRNFSGDHQTWVTSHTVTAGSSAGVRWYEFRAPETSTTLSVYQQGTFAPDSKYRWMSSIAMDKSQNIMLGYSVSSSSVFPSISYTGRVPSDPLGTMETEASIVAGTGSQINTSNRWGDYTNMAIDASDDCTFWYTDEYYTATASFGWSTRLAALKFPSCSGSPQPDFTISASPSSLSVAQGNQGQSIITTSISNGFNSAIALSASGVPSGTIVSFNPSTIPAPGSGNSTMTISVGSTTAAGTYPITVTGNGGGAQHSTTVNLTVTVPVSPSFTLSDSPSSLTITQGGPGGTSSITVNPLNGFNGTVSLTATGLPSGVTASFNPPSTTTTSTLTLTANSTATTGTTTVTITGTSGSLVANTTLTLTIKPATQPDFTISASPSSVSVPRGGNGNSTITITSKNNFNSSTTLSATGLPSGVTATFSPNPVTPPVNGSATSTLTFTASPTATVGTSTVTVTGTSGSLVHSTTITLTITTSSGQIAVYNSTLMAPACATVGSSCDSGPSLLLGRDSMVGGAEPHQPNTIYNSCADGTGGSFHSDESNDRIVVASTSGGPLTHGTTATITATVWAYQSGYYADALDLYYAADATRPSWVFIKTIVPTTGGGQNLSATFTLPTGSLQAVRAQFRYWGSASPCTQGSYNDHDDLIFAVQ